MLFKYDKAWLKWKENNDNNKQKGKILQNYPGIIQLSNITYLQWYYTV